MPRFFVPNGLTAALGLLLVFGVVGLSGCNSDADVQTQSVPPSHRQLLALSGGNDLCVFVRMQAAKVYVDRYESAFDDVIESLRIAGEAAKVDTPANFVRKDEGPNRIIFVPESDDPVRLSVIWFPLPRELDVSEASLAQLVGNDRRSLGLPAWTVGWKERASENGSFRTFDAAGRDWVAFDFTGAESPIPRENSFRELAPFEYDPPAGWRERPADEFRLAIFEKVEQGDRIELTLSKSRGGVAANVNRWRGQVGLDRIDATESPGETVRVDGRLGFSVVASGKDRAIRGVVVPLENEELLFVKLTGPPEAVAKAETQFRAFVESLKIG